MTLNHNGNDGILIRRRPHLELNVWATLLKSRQPLFGSNRISENAYWTGCKCTGDQALRAAKGDSSEEARSPNSTVI